MIYERVLERTVYMSNWLPSPRVNYLRLSDDRRDCARCLANRVDIVPLSVVLPLLLHPLNGAISNLSLVLVMTGAVFLKSLFGSFPREGGSVPLALELDLVVARRRVWSHVFETFVVGSCEVFASA